MCPRYVATSRSLTRKSCVVSRAGRYYLLDPVLRCTGLTISRRGPPWVSGTLPSRNAARQIADVYVFIPINSLPILIIHQRNFLFLSIYLAARLIDQLSQHNRSRMTRARPDGSLYRESALYFFTRGGSRRPVSSAVCRQLTENASRHYEESSESGPTDQRAPKGPTIRIEQQPRLGSQHLRPLVESPRCLQSGGFEVAEHRFSSGCAARLQHNFRGDYVGGSQPFVLRRRHTQRAGAPMHSRSVSRVKRAAWWFVRQLRYVRG